ncbi:OsmC family protein [Amycolatopsis aidingensis]|uniref:OsmC family protein n=1 Tax=Amycolatopsis aidingensis TaxID=2842453 RepID=UPI001C0DDC13|nr:OsmC family protein [Amycolatopsis aidingensis]
MAMVTVRHLADDKFRMETREHVVLADQPSGREDEAGPTPVELLVMALAACAGYYGVRNLRSQELPADGLTVRVRWSMRTEPARVGRVQLDVLVPAPLQPAQRDRLLAAIDRCTVHNTLRQPPRVEVDVVEPSVHRAGGPDGSPVP